MICKVIVDALLVSVDRRLSSLAVDLLNNSNSASQNAAITNANNPVQVIQSHQTTMITNASSVSHPTNVQLPLQTPTSNLVVMATNVNDNSKQIINNLAREMMESTGLHTTGTASILTQANLQSANLIVKQEYVHMKNDLPESSEMKGWGRMPQDHFYGAQLEASCMFA